MHTCLLSELGLDEGGEGDEVPDHVDEGHGQGEGEVDGGVGLQLQHRVQRHRGDPGVAVPLVQVVGPVHIPAPEPVNMLSFNTLIVKRFGDFTTEHNSIELLVLNMLHHISLQRL